MDFKMLKELSDAQGVSGFEEEVKKVIKKYAEGYYDEYKEDNIGNMIFKIGKGNKKVLIESHMDEVGIIVKHIDEKGFVYFSPLGGLDAHTLYNQRFVLSKNNKKIYAVCGSKPIHLQEEESNGKLKIKDLFLDFGVKSKKEIEKIGIEVGDVLTYDVSLVEINDHYITGKALDNRSSCYASLMLMRKIYKDKELTNKYTFFFAFTTQEEVGLKGARVVAFEEEIDYALVLDTSPAGDTPHIEKNIADLEIGKGVVIDYVQAQGAGLIMKKHHLSKLKSVFSKHKIPYQVEVGIGGVSDAAIIYITKQGIPTIALGVAVRYLHTPVEMLHKKDLDYLIEASYLVFKENVFE